MITFRVHRRMHLDDVVRGESPWTWEWRRPLLGPAPPLVLGTAQVFWAFGDPYLMTPKSAPHTWVSGTVPMIGPKPLEKPVRLRTCSCGRGMSVGKPLLG